MLYAVLTYFILRMKNIPLFVIVYVAFCVLLVLNLAGCNRMIETVSGIH